MVLLVEIIEVTAHLLHRQQGGTEFLREVAAEYIHLDIMGNTHLLIHDLLLLAGFMKMKDSTHGVLHNIAEKQHTQKQQSQDDEIQLGRIPIDGFLRTSEQYRHIADTDVFAVYEEVSITDINTV